ncbi:hypothetical protein ACWCQZ_44300 [Streptomyces sp. NPDC002285]
MPKSTSTPQAQHSPALAAVTHAAQDCRDIAQQVGIRNCDTDPEWRASEYEAEQRYNEARAAGHSVDEVAKAGRTA